MTQSVLCVAGRLCGKDFSCNLVDDEFEISRFALSFILVSGILDIVSELQYPFSSIVYPGGHSFVPDVEPTTSLTFRDIMKTNSIRMEIVANGFLNKFFIHRLG